eukprot:scaffold559_cov176-Ochromonas_danica.AAC.5
MHKRGKTCNGRELNSRQVKLKPKQAKECLMTAQRWVTPTEPSSAICGDLTCSNGEHKLPDNTTIWRKVLYRSDWGR